MWFDETMARSLLERLLMRTEGHNPIAKDKQEADAALHAANRLDHEFPELTPETVTVAIPHPLRSGNVQAPGILEQLPPLDLELVKRFSGGVDRTLYDEIQSMARVKQQGVPPAQTGGPLPSGTTKLAEQLSQELNLTVGELVSEVERRWLPWGWGHSPAERVVRNRLRGRNVDVSLRAGIATRLAPIGKFEPVSAFRLLDVLTSDLERFRDREEKVEDPQQLTTTQRYVARLRAEE
jgi:hypothetical protein